MTERDDEHTPVDIDLLADYLAGVLPKPEADAVSQRVANNADWARVAEQIRSASPTVANALRAVGATDDPMPEAVLDRVLAALPTSTPARAGIPVPAAGQVSADAPQPNTVARVVSLNDRRRRRRVIWSNVAKVAAAVVVVAGLGVGLSFATQHPNSSSSSAGGEAKTPPYGVSSPLTDAAGSIPTEVSGHDYTNDLGSLAAPRVGTGGVPAPGSQAPEQLSPSSQPPVPAGLERLAGGGLNACVTAVTQAYGQAPTVADFAYYRGRPALIFRLATTNQVVAVGPDCGLPGHAADVLATSG